MSVWQGIMVDVWLIAVLWALIVVAICVVWLFADEWQARRRRATVRQRKSLRR